MWWRYEKKLLKKAAGSCGAGKCGGDMKKVTEKAAVLVEQVNVVEIWKRDEIWNEKKASVLVVLVNVEANN